MDKKEYHRQYYNEHKNEQLERHKKYNQEHKEEKRIYNEKYRLEKKEEIIKYRKIFYKDNKEKILKHKKENRLKNKEEITKRDRIYYQKNKDKIRERARTPEQIKKTKERYYQNKEITLKKQKEYYHNNKTKIIDRVRNYSINNKEIINERHRNKKINNPVFRLSCIIRSRISDSLKRGNYRKTSKTQQILGCSFEEFKMHLESKFESWMNWENYGKYKSGKFKYGWDIDHIVPLISGESEDDVIRLNHYTNLQPLCSYTNRNIKRWEQKTQPYGVGVKKETKTNLTPILL